MRNDRASVLENLRRRAAVFPEGAPQARNEGGSEGGSRGGSGSGSFSERFFPDAEGGDLIARFMRMAKANAATTARVSGMEEVPRAAAEWLRGRGAALRMVCAADLAELDWGGAGIAAECRGAVDGDQAGATRIDCGGGGHRGDAAGFRFGAFPDIEPAAAPALGGAAGGGHFGGHGLGVGADV